MKHPPNEIASRGQCGRHIAQTQSAWPNRKLVGTSWLSTGNPKAFMHIFTTDAQADSLTIGDDPTTRKACRFETASCN